MPSALVLYATTHGHTAKVARAVAGAMSEDGVEVRVEDIAAAPGVEPAGHDAVVVGASVHAGHHQREIVDWARRHAAALGAMPAAFFSVCLTAADDTPEAAEATRRYRDEFADETGWTPRRAVSIAGALQYREYDFVTRLLMRLLMRRGDHPTDTSRDWDFTDWDAVARFGHECAALAGGGRPAPASRA